MIINRNTIIKGKNVILVPYRKEHVPKYHRWMQSEELQRLTASEPLDIVQEYEMQKSWMIDENKCTFIVLDKEKFDSTQDEIESMVGDTNLFFCNPDDRIVAEAEVMIAEESARGKKFGKEAMLHMLNYGIMQLGVREFVVKIQEDNLVSINMFKGIGFIEESKSEIFKEITFSKIVNEEWKSWLRNYLGTFKMEEKEYIPVTPSPIQM